MALSDVWEDTQTRTGVAVALVAVLLTAAVLLWTRRRTISVPVCDAKDLPEGHMREVEANSNKLLLVHTDKGEFRALGAKCTHYSAPLAKGVLSGDRVVCPWHAACFNVNTGDIEDGPVLDALPTYKTNVRNGRVYVELPKEGKLPRGRAPHMCPVGSNDQRNFVVVGAGPAGLAAAQSLRERGYEGKITLLTTEAHAPYDRPKLSKNFEVVVEGEAPYLRPRAFFVQNGISLYTLTRAVRVDTAAHEIVCENITKTGAPRRDAEPRTLKYDKLLVATGGRARTFRDPEPFTIPGADLEHIFALREASDSEAITAALKKLSGTRPDGIDVVIVGSSFIGMEAASFLEKRMNNKKNAETPVRSITVVGMEKEPFERVLGPQLGAMMRRLAENKGIQFRMQAQVKEFVAADDDSNAVAEVELQSAATLPADLVIIGAGIIPSTDFIKDDRNVSTNRDAIVVDKHFQAAEDVYAAGDVAMFPYARATDAEFSNVRIEHWDVAYDHGRVAAANMLGQEAEYESVPFFWTSMFGRALRYAGNCMRWSDIIVHGKTEGDKAECVAYYIAHDSEKVAAVLTINKDPYAVAAMELMRQDRMPPATRLRNSEMYDLPRRLREQL